MRAVVLFAAVAAVLAAAPPAMGTESELMQMIRLHDTDGSGSLDASEMARMEASLHCGGHGVLSTHGAGATVTDVLREQTAGPCRSSALVPKSMTTTTTTSTGLVRFQRGGRRHLHVTEGEAGTVTTSCMPPTDAERWTAALGTTVLVSMASMVGALLVGFSDTTVHTIMPYMLAFGVSAMTGNSFFHLLPEAYGLHVHGEPVVEAPAVDANATASTTGAGSVDESGVAGDSASVLTGGGGDAHGDDVHDHSSHTLEQSIAEKGYMGISALVLLGILLFFGLENVLHHFVPHDHHGHGHSHGHEGPNHVKIQPVSLDDSHANDGGERASTSQPTQGSRPASSSSSRTGPGAADDGGAAMGGESNVTAVVNNPGETPGNPANDSMATVDVEAGGEESFAEGKKHQKAFGWGVIIAGGVHNFTDGIIIGAAFSTNMVIGGATAIAVVCHELPQELGDYIILLKAGFSKKRALLYNFFSAVVAVLGCVIGLAAGTASKDVIPYLVAVTLGGFLYLALVAMVPQLLDTLKGADRMRVAFVCITALFGIGLMAVLALFSENILAC